MKPCGNSIFLKISLQPIPIINLNHIKVIHAKSIIQFLRRLESCHIGQHLIIKPGISSSFLSPLFQIFHLYRKDIALKRLHTVIMADNIMVISHNRTMIMYKFHLLIQVRTICHQRPSFSISPKIFTRIKAESSKLSPVSNLPP